MPKDQELDNLQPVKFAREGETLNKDTFAPIMNRFVSDVFKEPRKKDPNETHMHYMRMVEAVKAGNSLKAKVFFDKAIGMLTADQRQKIYDGLDEKQKESLKASALRELKNKLMHTDYYTRLARKRDKDKYADEEEKVRIKNELGSMEDSFNSLTQRGRTFEQAREIAQPYLTEEQLSSALDPTMRIFSERFIRNNCEYVSDHLKDMLTPEQMQELNATVENYVVPWERKVEDMGEKVYTAESEKAKAEIDAMQGLSPEQKDAMKKDIDAANDFLRRPNDIDDPGATYQTLSASNSGYDAALLKDEEERSKAQAEKEGLDLDAVEETIDPATLNTIVLPKEGKEKEAQQWQNADYKFAPETREAIKHVYSKMQEYGYLGKGIVLEQGSKEYGLSKLASSIDAYTDAIESGDAQKIAETSKAMMTEQAHVDELIEYVRENFPVDPKSENFARAGNVDVVRNKTFPPKYRLDEAVAAFNSIYVLGNFIEANGWTVDEFLDSPMKHAKEYFFETTNQGLNKALKGKTGGAALFEASRNKNNVVALGFGAGRPFETLGYADKDPAIRAHNHAVGDYLDKAVINNGDMSDVQRRNVAYTQGHLDRFLYVTEPRDNASLLGVPIYNPKTMGYDQPEPFDEASYLQNNGKSVGEMKELLDKNIKEFLYLSKTQLYKDNLGKLLEQPAYGSNRFVEIAQTAASKILIAKHAQKDDPAYQALKGILTNGQEYVNGLIQAEKDKVQDAEQQLEQAKKDGNQKEIDRLTAYIDANKVYKDINVVVTEQNTKYAENLASYDKTVSEYGEKRPKIANLKPDDDFNNSMVKLNEELAALNSRNAERLREVGLENVVKDDKLQVFSIAIKEKRAEIDRNKQEYLKQLGEDEKAGRISTYFRQEREKQIADPKYKYDDLPSFFPPISEMTEEQKADRQKEIEAFALKHNAEALGFVETKPEVKAEVKAEEKAPKQAEKQAEKEQEPDFTGKWFEKGAEVTADNLFDKIKEIDKRIAQPIEGDNWLENRKEYEQRGREKARLNVAFDEGFKTLSDDGKQKLLEALDPDSKKRAIGSAIYHYTELLSANGKSEESKALGESLYSKRDEITLEEVQEKAEKYLTEKEKANPNLKPYNHIRFDYVAGKEKAWEALVKNIPEDKLKSVALKADAKQTPMESMTLEEAKEPHYDSEIASLKSTIDNMAYLGGKELTSARKEELNKLLDNVQSMTARLNNEYAKELSSIRKDREESDFGMNRTRSKIAHDKLKDQGFNTIRDGGSLKLRGVQKELVTYEKGIESVKTFVLTDEARKESRKLRGRDFIIHDETRQKVKEIFKKFDEYGYEDAYFEPEEGSKVYALHKYAGALKEFENSITSSDPTEKLNAIEAAGKMQVEYDRIKDLAKQAGDLFGVNEGGYYPGNLDVERSGFFPAEFRSDLGGISALNGLYVMYRTLKENNVSPDDFFNDPGAFMEMVTKKTIDKVDINKTMKGKWGAEAMFDSVRKSDSIDPNARYGLNRTVETLAKIEKDPKAREYNMTNEQAYSLGTIFAYMMTEQRDAMQEVSQRHLDRFLMVKEPCEDASLMGAPSMDYDSLENIPAKDFDEIEYLMNSHEDIKSFTDRVINEGCKFIAMNANDNVSRKDSMLQDLPIERGFYAMQEAAIKYLTVRQDIDKHSESYRTLSELAERGPDFIKEQIAKMKDDGKLIFKTDENDELYDAYSKITDAEPNNLKVTQSLKDYKKSDEIKHLGETVRDADKTANRNLKALQSEVARAQRNVDRNGGEAEKQTLKDAQDRLAKAVADRKAQLLNDFRAGRIPEDYLNKRNEQLDNGKFNENLPKMFEADQLKSKKDYLEEYAKRFDNPDDFDELSKEEKNELYQRYVDNANRTKEQFIMQKYLEKEKKLNKLDKKTIAERIAAEDKRLAMMEKAYGDKTKAGVAKENKVEVNADVKKENAVEQVVIDENEPELNEKEKSEEKVEVKAEDKNKEKTEEKNADKGGERFDLDLDDNAEELNNDMLNFGGNEKSIDKDPLRR